MAVRGAGSFSGGECFHRSKGFMDSQFRSEGMLMAAVDGRRLGDAARFGRAFCLRLVLAIQFEIWLLVSPVLFLSSSLSFSVG